MLDDILYGKMTIGMVYHDKVIYRITERNHLFYRVGDDIYYGNHVDDLVKQAVGYRLWTTYREVSDLEVEYYGPA